MSKTVLVPLAAGFEEIEALTIVDVLRRADLEVVLAGLEEGPIEGGHGIRVLPDVSLDAVELDGIDAIVLPGGMGGTLAMMEDERVLGAVRTLHERGELTAAICAAPMVLARAGVVAGVEVTSHPSVRDRLAPGIAVDGPRVLDSGRVMTSQGAGTALEFSLAVVARLVGPARAQELAEAMVVAS